MRDARKATTSQVRIIAGNLRGRKITFNALPGLRPTSDRIRETLFNWLQTAVAGSVCLDAFAGSGALGFEALSRGARHLTAIDTEKKNIQQLAQSADQLGVSDACDFHCASATQWLASAGDKKFSLVFIDPPFAKLSLIQETIDVLIAKQRLAANSRIYIEQPTRGCSKHFSDQLTLLKEKSAGEVNFQLWKFNENSPEETEAR